VFHHNRNLGPFLQSIGSVLLRVVVDAHEVFLTRCTVMRDGHPLGVSASLQHGPSSSTTICAHYVRLQAVTSLLDHRSNHCRQLKYPIFPESKVT
jgi:hypothetical protein